MISTKLDFKCCYFMILIPYNFVKLVLLKMFEIDSTETILIPAYIQ